jgi:NitT/TauT family transport system ATP-binding protein
LSIQLQARHKPSEAFASQSESRPSGVRISGLVHRYNDRGSLPLEALHALELRLEPHHTLAVVGPSGCGKTTLLELVCGLQPLQVGSIEAPPAVLMPQRDLLLPWLSALDNAALALRIGGASKPNARRHASPLFQQLGLTGFERALPHELSGGMRQRVAFLRTLLSGKPLLCLDEPFGALDAITRMQMQAWLEDTLAQAPRTVILVTHDVDEAIALADRVAVLSPRPGRVVDELELDLPRPRERTAPAVLAARERVLLALGIGSARGSR